MDTHTLLRRLVNTGLYDITFHSEKTSANGYKISIQGKTIQDSALLYDRLWRYLYANDIPFKLATLNRYALRNTDREQSYKAMTIYCPDGFYFSQLCEDIYSLTVDYTGWRDIKTPKSYSHYAGGLFTRNDRDNNNNYLPAQ